MSQRRDSFQNESRFLRTCPPRVRASPARLADTPWRDHLNAAHSGESDIGIEFAVPSGMPSTETNIMCSQRMWRLVRQWDRLCEAPDRALDRTILGSWAATLANEDGRDLVVAIEARTYLTIVFPFGASSEFHAGLVAAVEAVLQDLAVPETRILPELDWLRAAPLARLVDPELREALRTVEFMCGIELGYHTDLRRVQRNLNEFPHPLPPDYVPAIAVRRVFGSLGITS